MSTEQNPILPPPAPRASAWPLWLVWLFGLFLGGSALLNLFLLVVIGVQAMGDPSSLPGGAPGGFHRVVEEGHGGSRGVLLVELSGVISGQPEEGILGKEPSLLQRIRSQIEAAQEDNDIGAVLLVLDTPGGGVTASDELYSAVAELSASGKPVLAFMDGLCASGGYYIAMACDRVLAGPTTVTGSIGVIMSLMNAERLVTEVLRLQPETIKSGSHKDMGSPFRAMSEDERAMLQGIVDRMYERFLSVVVANRSKTERFADADAAARLRALCDGRIYHAEEAVENGLIDGISDKDSALEALRSLAKLPNNAPLYRYHAQPQGLKALLQSQLPDPAAPVREISQALSPRFEYRWQPGLP